MIIQVSIFFKKKPYKKMAEENRKYMLAFYITLTVLLLGILGLMIYSLVVSFIPPVSVDATFRYKDITFNHLNTEKIHVLVHIAHKKNVTDKPTYTEINKMVTTVLDSPTDAQPWESLAKDIAEQIYTNEEINGVSVEILIPQTADTTDVTTATYTKGYNVNRLTRFDADA
jgi:hypothetical protein